MAEPRRIAILGTGLMGASLGAALISARKRAETPPAEEIVGYSGASGDAAVARTHGLVDRAESSLAAAVRNADRIVLATPLRAAVALLQELGALARAGKLRQDAVFTDVVSLKVPVLRAAAEAGLGARFVGGHPLVGGVTSGPGGARAELYRGAAVFLSSGEAAADVRSDVADFWTALGAHVVPIEADTHDRLMVRISHLPQLTANVLAAHLEAEGVRADQQGPGARGMTRLAGSSPEMWGDLVREVGTELAGELRAMGDRFHQLAASLEGPAPDPSAVTEVMRATGAWLSESTEGSEP